MYYNKYICLIIGECLMFRSMTSFGRAKDILNGREITVEIKSVNNRYFECQTRLPRSLSHLEQKIKPTLSSLGITRGKVDVSVMLEGSGDNETEIAVNHAFAQKYINALIDLKETYSLTGDIQLSHVLKNSDVFTFVTPAIDEEARDRDIMEMISRAAEKFIEGRRLEGERIQADICAKLDIIRAYVAEIKTLSADDIDGYKVKLEEKLKAVLADNNITLDENRILTECAIYADRAAIDEEIVRLGSHFVAFEEYMQKDEPVGRSIDFLLQEMNREINTIGSKCQNAAIARLVVGVKTELEKVREQIQNIE